MEYVLKTKNLCKSYGRSKALENLNLSVPKGSVYGLVGRNGAGKTTLIRLVCGLQEPSSGSFYLYGEDNRSKNIFSARQRIGAVVEKPSVYLDMSAYDNLKQQCLVLGLPSFDSIPEILSLVGLGDTGKKKARSFSLGMKQRLGIALALIGNPDFLVLDEPTNGLDPQGIVEIRELILKLNREQGITVLISSHILSELARLATHYGFIDRGKTIKEISVFELEQVCKKCLYVEVSNTKLLAQQLDKMKNEYEILSDTSANIFGDIELTSLVTSLSRVGCVLVSAQERDEGLESYFINLVGGAEK